MMTEEERIASCTERRIKLEQEIHEAELLLGILQPILKRAQALATSLAEDLNKRRRVVQKITPEIDDMITAGYDGTPESIEAIAKSMTLHPGTVRGRLINMGLVKQRESLSEEQIDDVVKRYERGESAKSIANSLDTQVTTITKHLRRRGFITDLKGKKLRIRVKEETEPELT